MKNPAKSLNPVFMGKEGVKKMKTLFEFNKKIHKYFLLSNSQNSNYYFHGKKPLSKQFISSSSLSPGIIFEITDTSKKIRTDLKILLQPAQEKEIEKLQMVIHAILTYFIFSEIHFFLHASLEIFHTFKVY